MVLGTRYFALLCLLTVLQARCLLFAAQPASQPAIILSKDLKAGQNFIGYTCFQGTQIEKFTGIILGVEKGAFAGSNMIWVELQVPGFGAHGVPSGMSGSPCYIDGKLIGAVAYGFSGSQKALAGLTPIESMLEVLELTRRDLPANDEAGGSEAGEVPSSGVWNLDELKELALHSRVPGASPLRIPVADLPENMRVSINSKSNEFVLKPLSVPIAISSRNSEVCSTLSKWLEPQGLSLVSAGIGGITPESLDLPALAPGSALGMPMMTGDLTVGGYGTVTYCDGNKLIGFGHPAFGWGTTNIPMSPCVMFTVQPSYEQSFKIGQVAMPTGSIRQDRQPAVGGVIGPVPRFIPMHVEINSNSTNRVTQFNFQVWDNRHWTPILVVTGLGEALSAAERPSGESTVNASYSIGVQGSERIEKQLFYSASQSPTSDLSSSLLVDLALLKINPFHSARLDSIDITINLSDRIQQSQIVSVTANKDVYRPGDEVRLAIYIQPYRGARELRELILPLDSDLDDGTYDLLVGDAESRMAMERERAPGLFTPMDYQQMLQALRKSFVGNRIYAVLKKSDQGLTIHGQELPALPPSLRSTFASSSERAFIKPISGEFLTEKSIMGNSEFVGSQKMSIQVNRLGRR